jgi:hypothetical protein
MPRHAPNHNETDKKIKVEWMRPRHQASECVGTRCCAHLYTAQWLLIGLNLNICLTLFVDLSNERTRFSMSESTTSLHPTHKPDPKPSGVSTTTDPPAGPVELTAMVTFLENSH